MPHCPAPDVRLCQFLHVYGCLYPRHNTLFLQGILQGQAIYHSCKHTHVISNDPIHALARGLSTSIDIASADHNGDLDTDLFRVFDLLGYGLCNQCIYAIAFFALKRLASQLQYDPFINRFFHPKSSPT